jgi:hypothetical protein
MSDDDRYQRVLEEFGKMYRSIESFKGEMATLQLEYWKATATAIRVLSDWYARDAATARQNHTRRGRLQWAAIGLNVLLLLIVTVYLVGR